jgi:hypothetical protein
MIASTAEPELMPSKENLLQALQLVARTPDGSPLDLDDLQTMQYAQLVGVLDAAVETLAQRQSRGGKGKSRRHLVVKGHRHYLDHPAETRDLVRFYQSSLERLAADMKSSLNDFPA